MENLLVPLTDYFTYITCTKYLVISEIVYEWNTNILINIKELLSICDINGAFYGLAASRLRRGPKQSLCDRKYLMWALLFVVD